MATADPAMVQALQQLLALAINVEPVLIEDVTSGSCWCVRVTFNHSSGLNQSITMAPKNATDLARAISKAALEASTKIIPAKSRVAV